MHREKELTGRYGQKKKLIKQNEDQQQHVVQMWATQHQRQVLGTKGRNKMSDKVLFTYTSSVQRRQCAKNSFSTNPYCPQRTRANSFVSFSSLQTKSGFISVLMSICVTYRFKPVFYIKTTLCSNVSFDYPYDTIAISIKKTKT